MYIWQTIQEQHTNHCFILIFTISLTCVQYYYFFFIGVAEPRLKKDEWGYETDIPGLVSRVQRPFEFLGLYGTHHGACRRHDIPAKMVSVIFINYEIEF